MKENNSDRFQFDIEIIKRWLRSSAIVFAPAIVIFLNQIQSGVFDTNALKVAVVASVIDLIRRYVTDYTK